MSDALHRALTEARAQGSTPVLRLYCASCHETLGHVFATSVGLLYTRRDRVVMVTEIGGPSGHLGRRVGRGRAPKGPGDRDTRRAVAELLADFDGDLHPVCPKHGRRAPLSAETLAAEVESGRGVLPCSA